MDRLVDFIAGGLGGVTCTVVGQPFDTIKVKVQSFPHLYKSLFQAVTKTVTEERLTGLYAGTTPALTAAIVENSVLFLSYGYFQRIVQWAVGAESVSNLTVNQLGTAGAMSAVIVGLATTPAERIKCLLQTQVGRQVHQTASRSGCSTINLKSKYSPNKGSVTGVIRQVVQEEGPFALWKGLTGLWIRIVPGFYVYFWAYNGTRKLLTPKDRQNLKLSPWRVAIAGGMAGSVYWAVSLPADVVKSRVQVRSDYGGSFVSALIQIVRNEGILALYKGFVPAVVRAFPANGVLLLTYEYTRLFFNPIDL